MTNTKNNLNEAVKINKSNNTGEQTNFDEALRKLLIFGLSLSVLLILFGLILSLIQHEPVPTTVPSLKVALKMVISFQSSGYLVLGILVLIATPIVRVISSFVAFLIERDWRFAGITLIVVLTVIASILTGSH